MTTPGAEVGDAGPAEASQLGSAGRSRRGASGTLLEMRSSSGPESAMVAGAGNAPAGARQPGSASLGGDAGADCLTQPAQWQQRIDLSGFAREGARSTRVAVFGDSALVGIPSVENGGVAVFSRRMGGGRWCPEQAFATGELESNSEFGYAVALGADVAVVGAPGDGFAVVFERDGAGWYESMRFLPSDESSFAFGAAVAVAPGAIVVGAPADYTDSGTAFVFEGEGWASTHQLLAPPRPSDRFGSAVAISSGGTAVIGAPGTNESAGAAFVFERAEGWSVARELSIGTKAGARFGAAVTIDGDEIVIGAPAEPLPNGSALVNYPPLGWPYPFRREGSDWVQEGRIDAGELGLADHLGSIAAAVSLSEGTLLSGAGGEENGRGTVRAYRKADWNGWCPVVRLVTDERQIYSNFGTSVAISKTTAWVGVQETTPAAYAFELTEAPPYGPFCFPSPTF